MQYFENEEELKDNNNRKTKQKKTKNILQGKYI